MVNDTKVGQDIRDKVFGGNPYSQLSIIRQSIWALAVLTDVIEGDKNKANEILIKTVDIDKQIQNILDENYKETEEELVEEEIQ